MEIKFVKQEHKKEINNLFKISLALSFSALKDLSLPSFLFYPSRSFALLYQAVAGIALVLVKLLVFNFSK